MSYLLQTQMASDPTLILRVAACAASEGVSDPRFWAQENIIHLVTSEDWGVAYAGSASETPGGDEDAITDEMILLAVSRLQNLEVE